MIETMNDADGLGLAAPQVHVPLRIAVFMTPDDPEMPEEEVTAIVNPEWELLTEERVEGWEGCLSIPGLRGLVPRFRRVKVKARTVDGNPVSLTADGFHARVIQHEFDHLDGVVFLDRMTSVQSLAFEPEWERYVLGEAE
jgi:peptide deformylase